MVEEKDNGTFPGFDYSTLADKQPSGEGNYARSFTTATPNARPRRRSARPRAPGVVGAHVVHELRLEHVIRPRPRSARDPARRRPPIDQSPRPARLLGGELREDHAGRERARHADLFRARRDPNLIPSQIPPSLPGFALRAGSPRRTAAYWRAATTSTSTSTSRASTRDYETDALTDTSTSKFSCRRLVRERTPKCVGQLSPRASTRIGPLQPGVIAAVPTGIRRSSATRPTSSDTDISTICCATRRGNFATRASHHERILAPDQRGLRRCQEHVLRAGRPLRRHPPRADPDRLEQRPVHRGGPLHRARGARDLPRSLSLLRPPRQSRPRRGDAPPPKGTGLQRPDPRHQRAEGSEHGLRRSHHQGVDPIARQRQDRREPLALLRWLRVPAVASREPRAAGRMVADRRAAFVPRRWATTSPSSRERRPHRRQPTAQALRRRELRPPRSSTCWARATSPRSSGFYKTIETRSRAS